MYFGLFCCHLASWLSCLLAFDIKLSLLSISMVLKMVWDHAFSTISRLLGSLSCNSFCNVKDHDVTATAGLQSLCKPMDLGNLDATD